MSLQPKWSHACKLQAGLEGSHSETGPQLMGRFCCIQSAFKEVVTRTGIFFDTQNQLAYFKNKELQHITPIKYYPV
jgi:hypothetical protein